MITIFINESPKEVAKGTSLKTLLEGIQNLPSPFAVAVNGKVVPMADRESYILQGEDKLMIIKAFYGG